MRINKEHWFVEFSPILCLLGGVVGNLVSEAKSKGVGFEDSSNKIYFEETSVSLKDSWRLTRATFEVVEKDVMFSFYTVQTSN